jgi:hypothetical protein
MESKPLTLEHQDLLDARIKVLDLPLSEYNFPDLYLFRDKHQYVILLGEDIYIKGKTYSGAPYVMPLTPVNSLKWKEVKQILSAEDISLFPIPEDWLPYFPEKEWDSTYLEEDSDYLFTLEKILKYPGRHLDGKRNQVNQFLNHYTPIVKPLTQMQSKDAIIVLDKWMEEIDDANDADYGPCKEALQKLDKLKLDGIIVYIDEEPVGFTIGMPLNSQVYVYHFAKALKQYKGIYAYLYQKYAYHVPQNFRYIDLEQDMGLPSLIKAKSEYDPDLHAKKYRLSLKNSSLLL